MAGASAAGDDSLAAAPPDGDTLPEKSLYFPFLRGEQDGAGSRGGGVAQGGGVQARVSDAARHRARAHARVPTHSEKICM